MPTGAVTEAEVKSINNLQVLTTYDKERLIQIEASEVYQRMKDEGDQYVIEAKNRFLQNHSLPQYGMLLTFVENYIREGTHAPLKLQQELENVHDETIKNCMTMCAALVDAYGEEQVWKETLEIASLTPCDEAMIIRVSAVLLSVGIDMALTTAMPLASLRTLVNSISAICEMITIHNDWVDCTKKYKKK